jgi:hypothetical protein
MGELGDIIFYYRWRCLVCRTTESEIIALPCEIRSASLIVNCQYTVKSREITHLVGLDIPRLS